jgi:hypothetical protein
LPSKSKAYTPNNVTSLGRRPLAFIENKGQVNAQVQFYLKSGSQILWLAHEGIVFDLLTLPRFIGCDPIYGVRSTL